MFDDKNNESKLQIDTKLYKMAILFELTPIAKCAFWRGFATESIDVTSVVRFHINSLLK